MRFVICMDTKKLRDKVDRTLRAHGLQTEVVDRPQRLVEEERWKLPIILETGRDTVRFCQVVYEMHRRSDFGGIIGVFDTEVFKDNQSLSFWVIGGRSALFCAVGADDIDGSLLTLARHMTDHEQ
jgi:hypothetical protein